MSSFAMKTKFIQLGAVATLALAGSIIAADPAPAPTPQVPREMASERRCASAPEEWLGVLRQPFVQGTGYSALRNSSNCGFGR